MEFLTSEQSAAWCTSLGVAVEASGRLPRGGEDGRFTVRCALPPQSARLAWLAGWLVLTVPGTGPRLLVVTEWNVWASSENWTLYDRLRRGYGEERPLWEAPGHLGAVGEVEDLAAFVFLGIAFGWGMHLIGSNDLLRIVVSHDEWIEFSSTDEGIIQQVTAEFGIGDLGQLSPRAV